MLSRRVHGCVNMGHLIPSSAGVKCRTPPRVQYREVHQQYTVGSSAITVLKLEDTVGGLGKRLYSYYFFHLKWSVLVHVAFLSGDMLTGWNVNEQTYLPLS